jgi:hypothetical protein
MKDKFMKFMQGRYGVDQFCRFTMGAALVLIVLAIVTTRAGAVSACLIRWDLPPLFIHTFGYFPKTYQSDMQRTRSISQ